MFEGLFDAEITDQFNLTNIAKMATLRIHNWQSPTQLGLSPWRKPYD